MPDREYTVEQLERILRSHGFVECDAAACNCGSWHHQYGLAERFREICDALSQAGYLGNYNGNLPLRGIQELISIAGPRAEKETAAAHHLDVEHCSHGIPVDSPSACPSCHSRETNAVPHPDGDTSTAPHPSEETKECRCYSGALQPEDTCPLHGHL